MSEFDFDVPEVKDDIYDAPIESVPVLTWHGKVGQDKKWGFWAIDQASFAAAPLGWEEKEIQFGLNPNAPYSDVYVTQRLRFCPVAWRRRWMVEAEDGRVYTYPWFTKRDDKVTGKQTGQVQVLGFLPDDSTVRMLGLRGFTKNVCWSNDPFAARGIADFPLGVMETLQGYAHVATEKLKEQTNGPVPDLPWLCAWWVDLIPGYEMVKSKHRPLTVEVGQGTWMNPFIGDMSVGANGLPDTRFVGPSLFEDFQGLRTERGIDWEKQWQVAGEQAPAPDAGYTGEEPIGDEEDSIPF